MDVAKGTRVDKTYLGIRSLFQLEPPGWTRLEPQSVSGDPTPGLEARVHDPLWLLARQWQLGEFHGEDAGSPVAVHISSTTSPILAWQPGDPAERHAALPWQEGKFLDVAVEREPTTAAGPGLRQRAESGAQFLAMLHDAGIAGVDDAILTDCPLPAPTPAPGAEASPLQRLLAGRVPDGERLAEKLTPGLLQTPPTLPVWLRGVADHDAAVEACREWLDWYRSAVAPLSEHAADSWIDERLEYRFSVGLDGPDGQIVLGAPAFGGGTVDWYAFEHDPAARPLQPAGAGATAPGPKSRDQTLAATPLRFAGMPAPRYWQFEDGQVNLAALETQPHDLARLLLVEFAMVFGNDWLVVPLDVPFGSLATIQTVSYTTTFDETFAVAEADDTNRTGHFSLFHISPAARGLFVPPAAIGSLEGHSLEEVLFLRDEMANMAWAIERIVQGPTGDPQNRGDEPQPDQAKGGPAPGADLRYLLETEVPDNWIPFVPVATGIRSLTLRKGAMVKHGVDVEPHGILLRPASKRFDVRDEEIPREGVRVRRTPKLARRVDGTYARWIARRVTVGRGQGSSNLAFDSSIGKDRPET